MNINTKKYFLTNSFRFFFILKTAEPAFLKLLFINSRRVLKIIQNSCHSYLTDALIVSKSTCF